MTRVPVRFTFTVSTELNYAMNRRRNGTIVVYSWSSLPGRGSSLGYSWSLVVTTRTSITILSPCNILQTSDTTNISSTTLQVPQLSRYKTSSNE
eukprot:scaffold45282_cov66-Attheya_sp.AAC.1